MVTISHQMTWPLLAGSLGVAFCGGLSSAQAPNGTVRQGTQPEIVVTAPRDVDEALTAKVAAALQNDRYILADHVGVTTQNGVVRVRGIVTDVSDLFAILRLAHRIAGKGRVVNEIEFAPIDFDGD